MKILSWAKLLLAAAPLLAKRRQQQLLFHPYQHRRQPRGSRLLRHFYHFRDPIEFVYRHSFTCLRPYHFTFGRHQPHHLQP